MSIGVEDYPSSLRDDQPEDSNQEIEREAEEALAFIAEITGSEDFSAAVQRVKAGQSEISAEVDELIKDVPPEIMYLVLDGLFTVFATHEIELPAESEAELDISRDLDQSLLGTETYSLDPVMQLHNQALNYPLLTKSQEVELAKRKDHYMPFRDLSDEEFRLIAEKNPDVAKGKLAFDQLMNSNLRLVISLSKRYGYSGLPREDVVSEGMLGLNRAVELFDWKRGYKFSTYATYWIKQAMRRGLSNKNGIIRKPSHVHEHLRVINKIKYEYESRNLPEPTDHDIVEETSLTFDQIRDAKAAAEVVTLLSKPIGDDGDGEFGDLFADERVGPTDEVVHERWLTRALYEQIQLMEEPDATIIKRKFGIGVERKFMKEIAREVGLSEQEAITRASAAIRQLGRVASFRAMATGTVVEPELVQENATEERTLLNGKTILLTPREARVFDTFAYDTSSKKKTLPLSFDKMSEISGIPSKTSTVLASSIYKKAGVNRKTRLLELIFESKNTTT